MNSQKKLMIGIAVVVIIILGGVIATGGMTKNTSSPATSPAKSTATSSTATNNNSGSTVPTTSVDIKDYMFTPMQIKVKVGDTVTWTNQDSVRHNVVADKPSSDAPNGPLIGQGETYSFKFTKAGTYTIHCEPHSYMHGTIIVE